MCVCEYGHCFVGLGCLCACVSKVIALLALDVCVCVCEYGYCFVGPGYSCACVSTVIALLALDIRVRV